MDHAPNRTTTMLDTFGQARACIAMIHAAALPSSPGAAQSLDAIEEQVRSEARLLASAGFDAIVLENMHDRPYVHGTQHPATTASMTRLALAIRAETDLPLGIQILSGGQREALAVALVADAQFIRCENFVFAHVAEEGLLEKAEAGPLLRERRAMGAEHVRVFTDIKKKHASHTLTADLDIAEIAGYAEYFLSDGLIVTGGSTGQPTDPNELASVRAASSLPLMVGSGANPDQLPQLLPHADAVIVGSWIKYDGDWTRAPDPDRCARMVEAFAAAADS